jgi:hypothetical protein
VHHPTGTPSDDGEGELHSELIKLDTTGWSERDVANFNAIGLHRDDGFRACQPDGVGKDFAIKLTLGRRMAALARFTGLPRHRIPSVQMAQEEAATHLLGHVADCLNHGFNPAVMLQQVLDAFRNGELPVGMHLTGAELIDIREDDEGYQRHYRLQDGRVLIWHEGIYTEILAADTYAEMEREEDAAADREDDDDGP